MIRCENLSKRYESGHDALRDINLEVSAGEWVFLAGHSGAGKTTLLKMLALAERPTRGQLFVDNRNITRLPNFLVPFHRRKLGMIFQDYKLLYDRSVFDNVALPLIIMGCPPKELGRRVRAALDQVDLLKEEQSKPMQLSTGQQQRVGIARAIVHRPKLIVADEPTGNLDPQLSVEVMNIFSRFHAVGVTVVVATHNIELIRSFRQRMVLLRDGRIVSDAIASPVIEQHEQAA